MFKLFLVCDDSENGFYAYNDSNCILGSWKDTKMFSKKIIFFMIKFIKLKSISGSETTIFQLVKMR